MTRLRLRFLVPVACALLGVNIHAATPTPLVAAVEKAAPEVPAGGFVVAEIEPEGVRYATAGRLALAEGTPPERMMFEIGSITKVFTGLLLAQASLDGKVGLDDPIARHLPADLVLDPQLAAITLRQLSAHTSGLPRLPSNLEPANPADPYADYTVERLYAFLREHRPEQPAPQPSAYSNLGVGLLGHVLERASGASFAELVHRHITGPLGMQDTVVTLDAEQQRRLATPHSGAVPVVPWSLGALDAAGALRSTAADMAKFVQALLDEQSPIAPAWRLVREPVAPFGARGRIGLGVMIVEREGQPVYYHGGGTGGFRSTFEVEPAKRRGAVVLLNNDTLEPAALVAAARRPAAAPPATARAEVSLSRDEKLAYTGVYPLADGRARFTVVLDAAGELRVRLTGQAFLPVGAAGGDRFFSRVVPAEFQFARDDAGRVHRLTLHQGGNTLPAERSGDAPEILFPTAEELQAYAGSYELAPGLIFDVAVRPLALTVKLTGQPALPVHCTRPDHFVYDVVEAALTFERDDAGRVVAVVLHQNGLNQRAPRRTP